MNNIWINDELQQNVSVLDRGFSYGDGIFTTIKVINGQCEFLDSHIKRLRDGTDALSIIPIDFLALDKSLSNKAKRLHHGVLKVIITRGVGARGYSCQGCDLPTVVIIGGDFPQIYQQWNQQGIALGVSHIRLGINPLTAGLKHLNRLEQVLIKQDIEKHQWLDALVLNCNGHIIETNMANVFWVKNNVVYTPSIDLSGVNGIMRQQVISYLKSHHIKVVEGQFTLDEVIESDEIFITNCLMGIVAINNVTTEHNNNTYQFGQIFNRLAGTFNTGSVDD